MICMLRILFQPYSREQEYARNLTARTYSIVKSSSRVGEALRRYSHTIKGLIPWSKPYDFTYVQQNLLIMFDKRFHFSFLYNCLYHDTYLPFHPKDSHQEKLERVKNQGENFKEIHGKRYKTILSVPPPLSSDS
jgi:hypothetical protein